MRWVLKATSRTGLYYLCGQSVVCLKDDQGLVIRLPGMGSQRYIGISLEYMRLTPRTAHSATQAVSLQERGWFVEMVVSGHPYNLGY